MRAIKLEVFIINKIIPYTIIDGDNRLYIMLIRMMKKLGLSITRSSFLAINIAN